MTDTRLKTTTRHSRSNGMLLDDPQDAPETSDSDEAGQKDETEERLEKLIFGDDAGFYNSLKSFSQGQELVRTAESEPEPGYDSSGSQGPNFEQAEDAELFFLDSGPSASFKRSEITKPFSSVDEQPLERKVAWVDSDDERLRISLASNTRLRKLRNFEGEDWVNGAEYIKRLRRQYERLHPQPGWVTSANNAQAKRRKRRPSLGDDSTTDEEIASDEEAYEDIPPAQPLAALLRDAGSLTTTDVGQKESKRRKLRSDVIEIQRTKDIPGSEASSVDSLFFHPYYPLLLSSGPAATVYLHHVSPHPPNPNPLLISLHLKKTPLSSSCFYQLQPTASDHAVESMDTDRTRVLLTSRRRYFHTWTLSNGTIFKTSNTRTLVPNSIFSQQTMEDLTPSPCGRYFALVSSSRKGGSFISILSSTSHQYQTSVRIDSIGGIASLAFWPTGDGICVAGKNGNITEFSIAEQCVLAQWTDEGSVGTTVISLGGRSGSHQLGGSRWIAIGSSSGIVNIYDRLPWTAEKLSSNSRPKPTKVFDQLTTPISHITFSQDGQMLVIGSRWKRDALRLIHLPSCTVYKNWPTSSTPLGRISSVAISPGGEYLAVGTEKGKIRLWEIRG